MPIGHMDLRNIISCAFPPNMHLPDPLTPGLKVEMIPEIHQHLMISPIFVRIIESMPYKQDLDSFLEVGEPVSIIHDVMYSISLDDIYRTFHVRLINAIVHYVGTKAIDYIYSKGLTPSKSTIAGTWHGKFFSHLFEFEGIGGYYFLTTICNQLTYPNSSTHYLCCMLQYLFSNVSSDFYMQDKIVRQLLHT
ncbi:hypothetical protein ACJMK2_024313 [Sinanodonta woodiana]|uniref:CCR4-Not complex component Not1 C-terminal domain-containing protein n=1 Tax=Sinanodonta woodiana TaxID=1069815 RepID=A0ABD3T8E6_SINWO